MYDMYRILVVDDQAVIRELVAAILTADGHHVTTAPDGAAALRLLEDPAAPYDLIVSDLNMPNLDGPHLYREVSCRSSDRRPRVVFMSGFVDSPQYARFLTAAQVPVLLKPFDVDQLSRLVRDILQAP